MFSAYCPGTVLTWPASQPQVPQLRQCPGLPATYIAGLQVSSGEQTLLELASSAQTGQDSNETQVAVRLVQEMAKVDEVGLVGAICKSE